MLQKVWGHWVARANELLEWYLSRCAGFVLGTTHSTHRYLIETLTDSAWKH